MTNARSLPLLLGHALRVLLRNVEDPAPSTPALLCDVEPLHPDNLTVKFCLLDGRLVMRCDSLHLADVRHGDYASVLFFH